MARSDKNTRRIDSGGDSSESSQSVSKTSSSKASGKSLKEQDADWGFEPSKSGMAVEAKMGMAIVVILVCAFGFLVYHKFDLRQRELLQAQVKGAGDASTDSAIETQAKSFDEFYPGGAAASVDAENTPPENGSVFANADHSSRDVPETPLPPDVASAPLFGDAQPQFGMEEPAPEKLVSELNVPERTVTVGSPEQELVASLVKDSDPPSAVDLSVIEAGDAQATRETLQPAGSLLAAAESSFPSFDDVKETVEVTKPEPEPSPSPVFDASPDFESFPPAQTVEVAATDSVPAGRTLPPAEVAAPVVEHQSETSAPPFFEEEPLAVTSVSESETVRTEQSEPEQQVTEKGDVLSERVLPSADDSAFADFNQNDGSTTNVETVESSEVDEFQDFPDPNQTSGAAASTLVAMLEPSPDVNLFEESPVKPRNKAATETSERVSEKTSELSLVPELTPSADTDRRPYSRSSTTVRAFESGAQTTDDNVPAPKPSPSLFNFDEPVTSQAKPEKSLSPKTDRMPAGDPPLTNFRMPAPIPDKSSDEGFGVAKFVEGTGIQQTSATIPPDEIQEVQPKDTYWTISKRVYGTARYFSSLALYNQRRIRDPRKLRPGMKVLVPAPEVLEKKYPELFRDYVRKPAKPAGYFLQTDGSPAYRVGERETLSEISQKHLGRASRWIQIYHLNRNILRDPNKLKPGAVLALPDDATDVHVAP